MVLITIITLKLLLELGGGLRPSSDPLLFIPETKNNKKNSQFQNWQYK
jgi:hypothetical protein